LVDREGNGLVFLLCTPRSGSSLATAMLQNHSRMYAAQEMWFLMSLHDLRTPGPRAYGGTGILRQFYNGVLPDETFMDACRAFALETYNGLLRHGGGAASHAIDKSPRYYAVLEFMDALFPRAKRIWLIRNPLAVLASHKKVSVYRGASFDTEAVLCGKTFDVRTADLTAGLFRYYRYFGGDRKVGVDQGCAPFAYRLRYERLVADPRKTLAGICRFIGVDYEDGMEMYGGSGIRDPAKTELYFSMGVGDPFVAEHEKPHRDSVDAWKSILNKREVEIYVRLLGAKLFEDLGYSEQLEEAERMTGVRFEGEPDADLLSYRSEQFVETAGLRWQPEYRMKTISAAIDDDGETGSVYAPSAGSGAIVTDRETNGVNTPAAGFSEADGEKNGVNTPAAGFSEVDGETSGMNTPATGFIEADGPDARHRQLLQLQMTVRSLENRLENSLRERLRLQEKLDSHRRRMDGLKSLLPFGDRLSRLVSAYLAKVGGKP